MLFTKRRPPNPQPFQFHNITIPWSNTVKYLGLLLDSKLLLTKQLHTVLHKATGTFLKVFPLLARASPLTIPNKIILYKLLRSMITYTAPVWSSTSLTNYRHLQVYQSKCLRVIGHFPPTHSHTKPSHLPPDDPNPPIHLQPHRQILCELPCTPEPPHS